MSVEPSTSQPEDASGTRSWVSRHKVLTGLVLLVAALVAVGLFFGWPLMQYYFHPQYSAALQEVRTNPKVTGKLGEPIETVRPFPGGTPNNDTLKLTFSIRGPKGQADVLTQSRLINGDWKFQVFQVDFGKNEKADLIDEIWARDGNAPAKFDPNAKADPAAPEVKVPEPMDIVIPDLPAPPE